MCRLLALFVFHLSQFSLVSNTDVEQDIPVGHLLPLGSHRAPDNSLIDDRKEVPSPKVFWNQYVKPSRAAVLRGAAKHSNAFTAWTDAYLTENFGDLEVRLEAKKEKSGTIPIGARGVGRDTIRNFIKNYQTANAYIVSELPSPMWHDISVQPCLLCGELKDHLVEVDLWMSGGGSKSILHKDAFNAINCLYNGTKEWKLIENKYEEKIYKFWEPTREIGGFSQINPEKVDLVKYPKVAEVPWSFVTVHAGDCLFLPKSYYHQVTSYGSSNVAVSILFSRFDDVESIDLDDCDYPQPYTPLSELDTDWKYPGHGNLSMGNPDLESIRDLIKKMCHEHGRLDRGSFTEIFQQMFPEKSQEWLFNRVKKTFDDLAKVGRDTIGVEDVEKLSREELRVFTLAIEETDISNTEDHEYGYIAPDKIRGVIFDLVSKIGYLDKKKFTEKYKEDLRGTDKFASKILDALSSNGHRGDTISREDVLSNLDGALQPFEQRQNDPYTDIPPGKDQADETDIYKEAEERERRERSRDEL